MERQICLPKYSLLLFSIYKANAQTKLNFRLFLHFLPINSAVKKNTKQHRIFLFWLQYQFRHKIVPFNKKAWIVKNRGFYYAQIK